MICVALAWPWSPGVSTIKWGVPDGRGSCGGSASPYRSFPTDARVLLLPEGRLQQQQLSLQPRLRVPEGRGLH